MAIILSSEKNAFVLFLKYDAKSNLAFSLLLELTLSLPTVLYSWLQTVFQCIFGSTAVAV